MLQGILDFASVEAVAVAPGAPDAHHNRAAVIQLSAYLYDQPPSTRGAMFGNAMVNSGAYFVLRRYVKRRAVALVGDTVRLWPWRRPAAEKRGYTEQRLKDAIEAVTGTGDADASGTAAVQAAAGAWGRGLALATVTPATSTTAALTPAVLYAIGRGLLLSRQRRVRHGGRQRAPAVVSGLRLRHDRAAPIPTGGGTG